MPTARKKRQAPVDIDHLRRKLKLKHYESTSRFRELHSDAHRHLQEKCIDLIKLREHSAKLLSAGTVAGTLLLSAPDTSRLLPPPLNVISQARDVNNLPAMSPRALLMQGLKELLPTNPRTLTTQEEKYLEQLFERTLGVKAKATLEGELLNTTDGYTGAEQHLRRYPGDTIEQHGVPLEGIGYEHGNIQKEGIAPGLGAW